MLKEGELCRLCERVNDEKGGWRGGVSGQVKEGGKTMFRVSYKLSRWEYRMHMPI